MYVCSMMTYLCMDGRMVVNIYDAWISIMMVIYYSCLRCFLDVMMMMMINF